MLHAACSHACPTLVTDIKNIFLDFESFSIVNCSPEDLTEMVMIGVITTCGWLSGCALVHFCM